MIGLEKRIFLVYSDAHSYNEEPHLTPKHIFVLEDPVGNCLLLFTILRGDRSEPRHAPSK